VTPIRPLERGDLDAVARLFELVARSGTESPPAGLAAEFERTVLDHPWVDPELPSLVYEDDDAGIVGFLGSHPRRLRLEDRELRLACSGQLVARPDFQRRGVGAVLLRRYLSGAQDLSFTDGATDAVRAMWEGLGGAVNGLASVGWTRVLRPAGLATAMWRRRRGGAARAARATRLPDLAAERRLAPPEPVRPSEPLTAGGLLEGLDRLARRFPLRPAYDERFLDWLFRELEAVRSRGELVRRLVHASDGRAVGWYVAYVPGGGIAQAIQVAAAPANTGLVLDDLFHRAAVGGAVAVQGRLEPHLHDAVRERRCLLRRTEWALVHGDADARGAIAYGRALLTRMEGEWWMGHHLM
jgi:GNAT superfamily N-acetyltransferase